MLFLLYIFLKLLIHFTKKQIKYNVISKKRVKKVFLLSLMSKISPLKYFQHKKDCGKHKCFIRIFL